MRPALASWLVVLGALTGCDAAESHVQSPAVDMSLPMDGAASVHDLAPLAHDLTPPVDFSSNVDGFVTAQHSSFPQLAKHTGAVLNPTKLVTITYANDGNRATAEQLGDYLVSSKWLTTIGADYGITSATHLKKVELTGDAPTMPTDASLVSSLWQWIGDKTIPSDPNAFYMVYFPMGTHFDSSPLSPGVLCTSVGAYHWNAQKSGQAIAYGVYVDCGAGWDPLSYAISHELAEAATDPFGNYEDGYFLDVASPDPWVAQAGFGGEVADLCELAPFDVEGGWQLARVWSNSAAMAGSNPCVPSDGAAYAVSATPSTMQTMPAGSQLSFTLTGWSNAPRADWSLTTAAGNNSAFSLAEMNPSLSHATINNGETVTLTLTIPANATAETMGAVQIISASGLIWPVGFVVQ